MSNHTVRAAALDFMDRLCETATVAGSRTYKVRLTNGTEYGPSGMDVLVQWARQGRIPSDAVLIPSDGGPTRAVVDEPALAAIVQAPPTLSTGVAPAADDAPMSGIIPYRNPAALIGYYLAVFSLIPILGILLGIPAFVLGIVGLRKRLKNPRLKGLAHAWIAIIGGALTTLIWLGLLGTAIVGMNAARP